MPVFYFSGFGMSKFRPVRRAGPLYMRIFQFLAYVKLFLCRFYVKRKVKMKVIESYFIFSAVSLNKFIISKLHQIRRSDLVIQVVIL